MENAILEFNDINLVSFFKTRPENDLINLLEQVLVSNDTEPLNEFEKTEIENAISEYELGEVVKRIVSTASKK